MPSLNYHPIFAAKPFVVNTVFDPIIPTNNYNYGDISPTIVFNGSGSLYESGNVIKRVTVVAAADTTNSTISAKLIYLYVNNGDNRWYLHQTATMPAATVSDTVPPSTIEWTFGDGLLLGPGHTGGGYKLGIMASVKYSTNGWYGDYLSVTVEGASFKPAY